MKRIAEYESRRQGSLDMGTMTDTPKPELARKIEPVIKSEPPKLCGLGMRVTEEAPHRIVGWFTCSDLASCVISPSSSATEMTVRRVRTSPCMSFASYMTRMLVSFPSALVLASCPAIICTDHGPPFAFCRPFASKHIYRFVSLCTNRID